MAKKVLIPAVAYLRKSTKGKGTGGKERQEKSIPQQLREIEAFAKQNGLTIIRTYTDEGISGWKRELKRPQFNTMLNDAKERRDFQAVIVDDLDRFSRADVMEVFSDLTTLSAGGVRYLHCINQGLYELGDGDIGKVVKLLIDAHGGNEFSRKLGRRIALSRRNAATKNLRSGGHAPFGYANDTKGGLVFGDPEKVAIVQSLFARFDSGSHSLRSLANDLNSRGISSPRGIAYKKAVSA